MAGEDDKNEFMATSLDKLDRAVEKVSEKCADIDKSITSLASRFESHLDQDEKIYSEFKNMVGVLHEDFKEMLEILSLNTQDVKHHIHRTDVLQDLYEKTEARLSLIEQERLKKIAVREFLVETSVRWSKIIGIIATSLTIIYYVIKIKMGT